MKTNRFKFRAWDILDKKMLTLHHLCLFPESDGRTIAVMAQNANLYPMDRVIVMQCTSLKDKNGKLIFEADIIKDCTYCLDDDHECRFGLVKFGKSNCSCCYGVFGFVVDGETDIRSIDEKEVVGNIYENPELLKGGEV